MKLGFGLLLCLIGDHDLSAPCEGYEKSGPPEGHPARPAKGDSSPVILAKFASWTRLQCSRCSYVPKVCR